MTGWPGGSYWYAPRPGSGRRPCWPTGPAGATGQWPGCRWTRVTMTRHGSGGTRSLRWTGCTRGWPSGPARCSARRRRAAVGARRLPPDRRWAAGLQLAALSLRGQPDVTAFVAAFSGSHRYVLDYLAGEVLEGQTDRVREFLLETSVLERLSGRLCDAVTGRTDSQAMLEQVERANLFLVPLDEVRGWWRYHHLFADLLRARLKQQQPGQVAGLHHNAAAWCEEHGLADDAVRHALAAGDTTWAARLIERHFDE